MLSMAAATLSGVSGAFATVTLTNGSFEDTGALYNPALGGLYEPSGWANLSGLNIQASSQSVGTATVEGLPASGYTGSRFLRLDADIDNPAYIGTIALDLGTMVSGETYTISADIFGGAGVGVAYGASVSLVDSVSATPSTTYATQSVTGVGANYFGPAAFNVSYSATVADDGNPLVLLLRAQTVGAGQAIRGGLDNLQLTSVPEPSAAALLAGAGMILWLRRRRA